MKSEIEFRIQVEEILRRTEAASQAIRALERLALYSKGEKKEAIYSILLATRGIIHNRLSLSQERILSNKVREILHEK